MPAVAWVSVGVAVGIGCLFVSQRLLRAIASDAGIPTTEYSRWWCMASAVLGGVTGWVAMSGASPRDTVLTVLIAALTMIQAPLDFVTRRLSRYATLISFGGVLIIWVIEVVGSSRSSALRALVIALVVVTLFAALHRLSPQSLGWAMCCSLHLLPCRLPWFRQTAWWCGSCLHRARVLCMRLPAVFWLAIA